MTSKHITHLPLLYNPYLNCLFNNPNHHKSPLKQTVEELAKCHTDYTILVPPSHILHDYYDPSSSTLNSRHSLKDLCYTSEDFIRSHIIKTTQSYSAASSSTGTSGSSGTSNPGSSKSSSVIYNTINGKQILIKNGMVFTGKGFKKSVKLRILSVGYMPSFCEYFPKGSKFMVIYIEDTLFGSQSGLPEKQQVPAGPDLKLANSQTQAPVNPNDIITFEKLLRSFPLLSKAVSDKFYKLFHHNNNQFRLLHTNTQKKLIQIKLEFQNMLEEAYKIISDSVKVDNPESEQTYNLINHIIKIYPGIDLNRLVHEYVELNLYDKLWSQLIFQFNYPDDNKKEFDFEAEKFLTFDKYSKLSCLALNQLDIPIDTPWELNDLQRRVFKAIDVFEKLSDPSIMNSNNKTKIIFSTMKMLVGPMDQEITDGKKLSKNGSSILTPNETYIDSNTTIDADTLIGLLIMVIVHSKIDNIEAHLYYMKNFNSIDYSNDGHFNYILSNFDAVLYHLSHDDKDLTFSSQQNFELWSTIQSGNVAKLTEILDSIQKSHPGELPSNHFLKSKNMNGESCLMFGIKTKSFEIWDLLLNYNPKWFSIDDILFDKNITTNQSLLIVGLIEETEDISKDLVELLLRNSSDEELQAYFNSQDNTGRTAGHYLFHNYHLIPIIGHFIDWEINDLNHHTPLFTLSRCYDHLDYDLMLELAFSSVYEKYGNENINFNKHKDKLNNGLLHIIARNLAGTRLLSDSKNLIDVNAFNSKSMTALTTYVKYNRRENLKYILEDNRLDFLLEDPKSYYNVFDYLGISALKSVGGGRSEEFNEIEKISYDYFIKNFIPSISTGPMLTALNGKYDPSRKDWMVFFKDTEGYSNYKSLETIQQILYITKLEAPYSIFPDDDVFYLNFGLRKSTTPYFFKNRVNRLIENLNILFISLEYQNTIDKDAFFKKFLVQDLNETSTFESLKQIAEKKRLEMGEVVLKEGHVLEMKFFLEYSIKDLSAYKLYISRFNKLVTFGQLKSSDLRFVYDRAIAKLGTSQGPIEFEFGFEEHDLCEGSKGEPFGKLNDFCIYLELCVKALLINIDKVLGKIHVWKEIYSKIKELNGEIKKFEETLPTKDTVSNNVQPGNENSAGSPELVNGEINSLARRGTFTLDPVPDEPEDSSHFFNLGGIIENKRSRYKKLILEKADKVKQIMSLNVDIKRDHETLAAEISNFLKFRSNFLRFAIKQYTRLEIQKRKHRVYQLSKILQEIRR